MTTSSKPAMHWLACGCLLQEGEQHYCTERLAGVIVLPRALCEHEHWSPLTESCAQCGLTREQRETGTLDVVQR